MTSSSQYAVSPRSRRAMRSWSIAVVTAGAVLIPAGSALADHMPGMNGTMCPHASGEGPDALAAPAPNEPAASERAPSTGPLAPAGEPSASTSAPKPAVTKPAAQVTKPATQQVTKPATQVQTQRPATTTAQSAPVQAVAKTSVRAVATPTVAAPSGGASSRSTQPRAKRSAQRTRSPERSFERRFNGLEPRAARPSATPLDTDAVAPAVRTAPAEPTASVPLVAVFGLLTLGGLVAVVLLGRRRGTGGAAAEAPPERPAAPTYAEAAVEAELHEIISEVRARELLVPDEAERGESVGTR